MGETVIKVENVGKCYRIGEIGTGTLRNDLKNWWYKIRGKNDALKVIDEVNDRTVKVDSKWAWALKDISFEVNKGEVLGIIGSNGAGKSTLLKLLSEITSPTEGIIKIKGQIASLLEVGTGFHPELTGRENIFLNGAILGMTKKEIRNKFDEIVSFAGVERYIDTPVKRYSSGMYVRLAFAVAAHLEPEILIIDEVLAVGDAEFQKKCLGKMKDVSQKEGRTILFVSHNMQAVNNLCNKVLWLNQGRIMEIGETASIISKYLSGVQKQNLQQSWNVPEEAPGNEYIRFKKIELIPQLIDDNDHLDIRTPFKVKFQFWNYCDNTNLSCGLVLYSYSGECVFDLLSPEIFSRIGVVEGEVEIPGNFLNDGSYYFSLNVVKDTSIPLVKLEECISFELEDYRGDLKYYGKWWGVVRPKFPYRLKQLETIINGVENEL